MKTYRVKIWNKSLVCPICDQGLFYFTKVKVVDFDEPVEHEIRYLFECETCGYAMMFGAVTRWEPEEELNFKLEET